MSHSAKVSVKWGLQTQLARTVQNCSELAETRPLLANAGEPDRFTIHNNIMNQRCILFRRMEVFYYEDKTTGKQLSPRTKNHEEAKILLNAKNESFRQSILNLQIAKAYLIGSDNGIATRTWQQAIESLTNTKQGANQHRWQTAAKDKAFVSLMPKIIIETNGELLLKVMQTGTVSTNVYLRRPPNFCVDMNWLPWPLSSIEKKDRCRT
jgi:hypothetical protein